MHWTSPGITSSRFRAEICWGGLSFPSCFTASQYGSGPAEATLPPSHVILDTQKGREQILRTVTFAACLGGNTFFFFLIEFSVLPACHPGTPLERKCGLCLSFPSKEATGDQPTSQNCRAAWIKLPEMPTMASPPAPRANAAKHFVFVRRKTSAGGDYNPSMLPEGWDSPLCHRTDSLKLFPLHRRRSLTLRPAHGFAPC